MKFCVHAIALLSIISTSAFAQVNLGAKGGLNLSNISRNNFSENLRTGVHGGLYFNILVLGKGAIQTEVLYSMKGARFTQEGRSISARLNYLDIPALAVFAMSPRLNFQFGPQFSYLAHVHYECENTEHTKSWELNDQSNFNSIDVGLAMGIEYKMRNTCLGFRYIDGFNQIQNNKNEIINGNEMLHTNASNSLLQFYVALPINE